MAPTELSVVIGTYNRLRFLRATLESVREELAGVPHEIIVIDGGSDDGTIGWLTQQKDVISVVQHNRGTWRGRPITRRSWGYFMNLGFKAASARLVCMLSDDCLVVPGAIHAGMRVFDERTAQGEQVGAVAFYWRNVPVDRRYRVGVAFGERMFVNHGLFLRSALEDVGYIDEDNFSFYHADTDLALRLADAGYACVDSTESFVEHYADANPVVRASNLERQQADWKTYVDRWSSLGEPARPWKEREYSDPHGTARRYWGRWRTSALLRRLQETVRLLANGLRARVAR
jgi:GT2 family glycosyltransferase